MHHSNIVLIFGSAPDVTEISQWNLSLFRSTVAINNAWQVIPSWNYLIFPEDFPTDRRPDLPVGSDKKLITADEFVIHQNNFGGFIYAGGTMAFTAGYWALGALKPDIIAFIGCDMVYSVEDGKPSHFYGQGCADPLRDDITLQSLEAKSNRLLAAEQELGYLVPSGRYWEKVNNFDPAKLRLIDDIWIDCFKKVEMSQVN